MNGNNSPYGIEKEFVLYARKNAKRNGIKFSEVPLKLRYAMVLLQKAKFKLWGNLNGRQAFKI